MNTEGSDGLGVDEQINRWRDFARRRRATHDADIAELEDRLRRHLDELTGLGLAADEAFLVALKRMGHSDPLSEEFAREHSHRLWKELVVAGAGTANGEPVTEGGTGSGDTGRRLLGRRDATADLVVMLVLAVVSGLATAALFQTDDTWILRFVALTTLPFLAAYFAWKRRVELRLIVFGAAVLAAAAAIMAWLPFNDDYDQTEGLAALHLPIALWFLVGIYYASGRWRNHDRRMDFVRFTGETAIYYALLGLGGGVLLALSFGVFDSVAIDIEPIIEEWVLPTGVAGALLVAAWLVEARQGVIESMAPVLTRIFSPLFTILFVIFLATVIVTGRGLDVDRDILVVFDLLLVVVLGLVLYSISARDPEAAPAWFDRLQLALILSALAIDVLALTAILTRITEFGFSPNKTAALGENLILLVNLAGAAWLYLRFLRGGVGFTAVDRWQTLYVAVYPVWAVAVVILFPLVF